jgi:chromosome segregation ATPase
MQSLSSDVEEMTAAADELGPAIESLGKAAEDFEIPADNNLRTMQARLLHLASNLHAPAKAMQDQGSRLSASVSRCDQTIRSLHELASNLNDANLEASIENGLAGMGAQLGDIQEVDVQLQSLLAAMQPAEVLSVPVRRALRPARLGLNSVRDAISVLRSWQD